MPLTLASLQQKMMHEIAPGNPEAFRALLNEADQLLLTSGKWHWVRKPLLLTPVDGELLLPAGYESILGARIGKHAEGVAWQEIEYLEEGPGLIPIQDHDSAARLIDQGLLERPSGMIQADAPGIELSVRLKPSQIVGGMPSWSTDGAIAPPPVKRWVRQYADAGKWHLSVFEGGSLLVSFTSVDFNPSGSALWVDDVTHGSLDTSFPTSLQRSFKVTGKNVTEVSVLARFESKEVVQPNDCPICQNYRALHRAMMSIHYEKRGDMNKASEYEASAVRIIAQAEEAYRGAANQIHKPSPFGTRILRHRPTNRR